MTASKNPIAKLSLSLLLGLIRVYRLLLSPLLGPSCRFHPSCSRYAEIALSTHGPLRGSWLAAKRIARCNPWHPGGVDYPPAACEQPTDQTTE